MSIKIRQLTPVFGAEITNIDLSQPLDAETFAEVRDAFEEYSVLVFPKQYIEDEAHLAFTELFGPAQKPRQHFATYHHAPLVNAVTNFDSDGNLYEDDEPRARFRKGQRIWHTDGSFRAIPSISSILRACIVPPEGGHTQFASLRAAYNALPEDKKKEYEGLNAIHHYAHSRRHMGITFLSEEEAAKFPPVRHPMVRVNPYNGKKALYVSGYAAYIEGRDKEESSKLLDELLAYASQPDFVYDHEWKVGDLVMYDNRASLHRATEYAIDKYPRMLRRTNVDDTGPTLPDNTVGTSI
jgi:alpha-ketoglutarate-dependent 2,4-dichlorophenoxyacetate dioxygenase